MTTPFLNPPIGSVDPVPCVFEPASAVTGSNAVPRPSRQSAELLRIARAISPNVLLLKCPTRLDRIEIGRVRREVDDAHAAALADGANTRIVMRTKVVEDDDVTGLELR